MGLSTKRLTTKEKERVRQTRWIIHRIRRFQLIKQSCRTVQSWTQRQSARTSITWSWKKEEKKNKNDCAKRRVLPKRRSEIFLSYLDGKFSKSNKVNRHSSGRLPRWRTIKIVRIVRLCRCSSSSRGIVSSGRRKKDTLRIYTRKRKKKKTHTRNTTTAHRKIEKGREMENQSFLLSTEHSLSRIYRRLYTYMYSGTVESRTRSFIDLAASTAIAIASNV